MFCTKCGAQNDDTARFCIKCGAQLVSVAAPPPTPAVPPPLERPAKPRRRRSRLWIAIPITLLVLVLLCGGLFLGLRSWLHLGTNEAAKFIPADTAVYMVFSPDPRQAIHLRRFQELFAGVPGPPVPVSDEQAQLFQSIGMDIDFAEDIQPWIGLEFSVAFLNAEETIRRENPAAVFAIATRNQGKSDAFLQKLREQQELDGVEFEVEEYRDVPVTYQLDAWGRPELAYATFNRFVVLTTDLDAMHQAIDLAQGKGRRPLARDETYQAVMAELPANRAGYVYLDGEQLTRGFYESLGFSGDQRYLGDVRGLGASIGLTGDGIRFDYALAYARKGMEQPPNPHKALKATPADAFAYLSGQNLKLTWNNVKEGAGVEARDLEDIQYELGIDLERDLLSWMGGEYALALLPDPDGFFGDPDIPLSLLLLVEAEDRNLVERKVAQVADALAYSAVTGGFRTQEIGGVKMQIIEDEYSGGVIGYGFVSDFLVIGTSWDALEAAVGAWEYSLSKDATFKKVTSPLPDKNSGYFYLDVEQALEIIHDALSPYDQEQFDQNVRPFLDPIRAVALATRQSAKGEMRQGTLFIYVK